MNDLKELVVELDNFEVLDINVKAYEDAYTLADENFHLAEQKLSEYLASINVEPMTFVPGYEGFVGDIVEGIKKGLKKIVEFIINIGKFIINTVKKFFLFIKRLFVPEEKRIEKAKKEAEKIAKKVSEEVEKELENLSDNIVEEYMNKEEEARRRKVNRVIAEIEQIVTTFTVHNPILPLVFERFMDITEDNVIFRLNKLVGELGVAYDQYNNYIRMVTTLPVRDEKMTLLEYYVKGLEELISKGVSAKVEFPVLCRAVDCLEELIEGYIRLADYDSEIEMRDLLKKVEKYIRNHDATIKNNDYILFRIIDNEKIEYLVIPNKDEMLAVIKEYKSMFEDNSISKERYGGAEGMANMTKLIRIAKLFIPTAAPEKRVLTLPKGDKLIKELYGIDIFEWINIEKYKEVRNIIFDEKDIYDTFSSLISDINQFRKLVIKDADFIKLVATRALKLGEMIKKIEAKYKTHNYVKELNDVAMLVSIAEKTLLDLFKVMNRQVLSLEEYREYLATPLVVRLLALTRL